MKRFRRLRSGDALRRMVRETHINKSELIYPIFVSEGKGIKNPVDTMPGIYQYSVDMLDDILKEIDSSGISGLLIFGIPADRKSVV